MKLILSLFTTYIVAFTVTYGHSYHQVGSALAVHKAIGAFISSMFWPLYWSVQVWK
jgi:hypothetical protein